MLYPLLCNIQIFFFLLDPHTLPPCTVSSDSSRARAEKRVKDDLPFTSYEADEPFKESDGFYCGVVVFDC